jgi:hypothetical protein
LKVILDLLVVKFLDRHQQKPMYVFGMCGVIALVSAFVFGLWAIGLLIFAHKPLITTPVPSFFLLSLMTGVLCILMGLLAEMITRTFFESQGKSIYLVKETKNLPRN